MYDLPLPTNGGSLVVVLLIVAALAWLAALAITRARFRCACGATFHSADELDAHRRLYRTHTRAH